MKNVAALESVNEFAAFISMGMIDKGNVNITDIIIDHIAKNEHLDKGSYKKNRPVSLIAKKLDKFFAH